jgi:hypothetical protein
MQRTTIGIALAFGVAPAVWGDLTVTGVNVDGTAEGVDLTAGSVGDPYTIYLKDGQMRMDTVDNMTILIRPAAEGSHEYVIVDHGEKKATVMPRSLVNVAESIANATGTADSEVRVVSSAQEPILGYPVTQVEYDYQGAASMPTPAAGEGEEQTLPPEMADMLKITMIMSGNAWVAQDVEGAAELTDFYQSISTNVAEQQGASGLAGSFTAVMGMISAHGFPLKTTTTTQLKFAFEGGGPMGGMMQGMLGNMLSSMPGATPTTTTSLVTEISTAPLDAALFYGGGIPEGYTLEVLGSE